MHNMHVQFVCLLLLLEYNFYFPDSFENGFISYRLPKNVTVTMAQAEVGITIFYIGATNGDVTTLSNSLADTSLSMKFMESSTMQLFMELFEDTFQVAKSRVSFFINLIGKNCKIGVTLTLLFFLYRTTCCNCPSLKYLTSILSFL